MDKVIQVDQELCAGCGICIDACSVGAIHLVDYQARIDEALCIACEACIEACPNEAISAQPILEPSLSAITLPAVKSRPVLVRDQVALPETATPARGMSALAGTALAFLGSEVAPRLVDVLITSLERKLARPTTTAANPLPASSRVLTIQNRGNQRRARYRRGHAGYRNHKGRR